MEVRNFFSVTLTTLSLLHLSGCAQKAVTNPPVKSQQHIGNYYAALEFEPGKSALSERSKSHLNLLADKALRDGREIGEIKILAWADKEYPSESERISPKDKLLAKDRGRNIEKYLKEELYATNPIDIFNMAKKPTLLGKITKNEDWEIKETVQDSGATGTRLPDGSVSYTKASKALVIIDYEVSKQ